MAAATATAALSSSTLLAPSSSKQAQQQQQQLIKCKSFAGLRPLQLSRSSSSSSSLSMSGKRRAMTCRAELNPSLVISLSTGLSLFLGRFVFFNFQRENMAKQVPDIGVAFSNVNNVINNYSPHYCHEGHYRSTLLVDAISRLQLGGFAPSRPPLPDAYATLVKWKITYNSVLRNQRVREISSY